MWSVRSWGAPGTLATLAGALVYLISSIGVTIAFNVPLNESLARSVSADAQAVSEWTRYVVVWTRWNHVRTVASLVAAALFAVAATAA